MAATHASTEEKLSWEEEQVKKKEAEFKALFDNTDWTKQAEIVLLFPFYMQEQIKLAKVKNVSKSIYIEPFTLKSITGGILLKETCLDIEANKRVCLLGENGTGKTTLFSTLASGKTKDFPQHISVHHCKEIEHAANELSLIDTVVRSNDFRNILVDCEVKLRSLLDEERRVWAETNKIVPTGDEKADAAALVPTTDSYKAIRTNFDFVKRHLQLIRSDDAYKNAAKTLRVLGFDDAAQQRCLDTLSGGLRMRVALAAAFFIEPDLLLLDDPSNHLDFPSVLWLEGRLKNYRKAFVLVTHDREMLELCNSVINIEMKVLQYYKCSFAEFEKKKVKEDAKKAEDTEKFLLAHRNADPSSAQGREKQDRMDWLMAYKQKLVMMAGKFTFPPPMPLDATLDEKLAAAAATSDVVIEIPELSLIKVDNVRFSYNAAKGLPFIFDTPISIDITTRTRIGVMGPNGAGKSTFLKLCTDKLKPDSGTVTRHERATFAYFSQHHTMELNFQQTPMEFMIREFPSVTNTGFLRNHLSKVGIVGTKADTRLIDLSGGQRSCVMFAKLTYICPHMLIMDEPTNFLDLISVDSLIAATRKYKGALMLVSHNRFFLNKCAQAFLSIVPGQFNIYPDLAKCERATYSFIQDLEEGNSIDSANLIKKPTDAASVGFSKTGGSSDKPEVAAANTSVSTSATGAKVISIKSSGVKLTKPTTVTKPVAAPVPAANSKTAAPAGNKKK